MSYDLIVRTKPGEARPSADILDELETQVSNVQWLELSDESGDLAVVSFSARDPDELVASVYQKLVTFASKRSLRIHDPQVGSDVDLDRPGVHPPGW